MNEKEKKKERKNELMKIIPKEKIKKNKKI